jgi:2-deoxy-D-gluconate 3-dehydrogenase
MTNPFDLTGKVAIVTGANTGIGQGIALALAEAGADIAAVGRSAATETVEKARALGVKAEIISADLSTIEPVGRIVDETVEKLGGLDILVNNAGIIRRERQPRFHGGGLGRGDRHQPQVHVLPVPGGGASHGPAGPRQDHQHRFDAELPGRHPRAELHRSKSGVAGLTKLLACEWASKGINVNAIAPGYIATNNTTALQADETRNRQIVERIPAGRWGARATWAARRCSSPPRPRIMSRAISSRSTAGGWRDDHRILRRSDAAALAAGTRAAAPDAQARSECRRSRGECRHRPRLPRPCHAHDQRGGGQSAGRAR